MNKKNMVHIENGVLAINNLSFSRKWMELVTLDLNSQLYWIKTLVERGLGHEGAMFSLD